MAEVDYTNPAVEPPKWGRNGENGWWWCEPCKRWQAQGGPAHYFSPYCRSGKRPHCTCDTCF